MDGGGFDQADDAGYQPAERDADTFKLFIGQLPFSCDEAKLRSVFADFGTVAEASILRDRATHNSKGCGFVLMAKRASAELAMATLHDTRPFGEGTKPLQVRPAGTNNSSSSNNNNNESQRTETKVFVGLIPADLNEDGLRALFALYGTVEDVTILRNQDGSSKRCGFVRFSTNASAQSAIDAVNQKVTPPGASQALIARFADNERQKQMRKMQQMQQHGGGAMGGGAMGGAMGMMPMGMMGYGAMMSAQTPVMAGAYGMAAAMPQAAFMQQQAAQQSSIMGAAQPFDMMHMGQMGQMGQMAQMGQMPMAAMGQMAGVPRTGMMGAMRGAYNGGMQAGMQGYGGMGAARMGGGMSGGASSGGGQHQTGPEGANLFIYNLAPQSGDMDLAQMFTPFGKVISAKVFTDKNTGLSKCFGFISFDNPQSAQVAIGNLDGSMMPNGKRLKVQLKTKKDGNSPYSR